jgi:SAM-dependent methyltransferase
VCAICVPRYLCPRYLCARVRVCLFAMLSRTSFHIGKSYCESNFTVAANVSALEDIFLGPLPTDDDDPLVHIDIGCGKGHFALCRLQILKDTGSHIGIGVDQAPKMVEAARKMRRHFAEADPHFCKKVIIFKSILALFFFLVFTRVHCVCRLPSITSMPMRLNSLMESKWRLFSGGREA